MIYAGLAYALSREIEQRKFYQERYYQLLNDAMIVIERNKYLEQRNYAYQNNPTICPNCGYPANGPEEED